MEGTLNGDLVKRGRKAQPKVNHEYEITFRQGEDGYNQYQNVTAANYAEAGQKADGLARVLGVTIIRVSQTGL